MKNVPHWTRIGYITGVVLFILGSFDPMEGSILIALGSTFIALVTRNSKDRHRRAFMVNAICILVGVSFLFYLSYKGGFGGTSDLSWWWGILIIPYPLGWLMNVVLLVRRIFEKKKPVHNKKP